MQQALESARMPTAGKPALFVEMKRAGNCLAVMFQARRIIGSGAAAVQGRDGGIGVFQPKTLGGRRQFHLIGWQALGRISAKEHAHIFLDEPRGVVSSQDHASVEAQRRIGKRLHHQLEYIKGSRIARRLEQGLVSAGASCVSRIWRTTRTPNCRKSSKNAIFD